mmetsp:Transcript_35753/g.111852  ORF Transcript_35753/g.111852 Transcript_35753/m.111852 type:complete len:88 (+) Transcript_35753:508-771(+)
MIMGWYSSASLRAVAVSSFACIAHISPQDARAACISMSHLRLLCCDGSKVLLGLEELGAESLGGACIGILSMVGCDSILGGDLSEHE